jgi:RNA polymerase sigma factor (TIGR02999 family)
MSEKGPEQVTRILGRIRRGDSSASDELAELVYDELRSLARLVFSSNAQTPHVLQPTALVHEAWAKMAGNLADIGDRVHFFAVAARAMRQVLADHRKAAFREKRGGGERPVTLHDCTDWGQGKALDLLAFEDALSRLGKLNERHSRVVELRILGGLTLDETASMLGVSERTVRSDWQTARAWLRTELRA